MILNNKSITTMEENLQCHHLLLNKDVVNATYVKEKDYFKSDTTKLIFKRVKLNGIIVAQKTLLSNSNKENEYTIWLDDGTSVIKVIIPKSVLKRVDSDYLLPSYNVTLFGKVLCVDEAHVVHCGGFKIEDNDASELYHWLRVMQERPSNPDQEMMFHTLSSLPSPNRLLRDNFLQSPIRDDSNSNKFSWSPDHAFATSTPIRAVQESPLKQRSDRVIIAKIREQVKEEEEEEEEDEFGDDFGSSIDLIALENDALQNNKRKFDIANME